MLASHWSAQKYNARGIFTNEVYSYNPHLEQNPGVPQDPPAKGTTALAANSQILVACFHTLYFLNILYLLLCQASLSLHIPLGSSISLHCLSRPRVCQHQSWSGENAHGWLSILLIGVWVVSSLELLQIVLLWTFRFLPSVYTIGPHFW